MRTCQRCIGLIGLCYDCVCVCVMVGGVLCVSYCACVMCVMYCVMTAVCYVMVIMTVGVVMYVMIADVLCVS